MLGKNRIQEIRWERNISATLLSRLSGVSASQIYRIERYEVSPTFDTMIRISRALHMDVWDVFYC